MEKVDDKYDFSLYEYHNLLQQNILVSYKGPIDERIMNVIGDNIELVTNDGNDKAKSKIFKIFMELAQNVWLYSAESCNTPSGRKLGMGTLVIGEFGDSYTFVTGNVVRNSDIEPVGQHRPHTSGTHCRKPARHRANTGKRRRIVLLGGGQNQKNRRLTRKLRHGFGLLTSINDKNWST